MNIHPMRMNWLSLTPDPRVGIKGALWVGTLVLLLDSFIQQVFVQHENLQDLLCSALFISPIILGSVIPLILILRSRDEKRIVRLAFALILFSLISRLLWIFYIDAYQTNDFRFYLQDAIEVVQTGRPDWTDYGTGVYWRRTAFYTYPIVLLFGPSLVALKIVNVLLVTCATWFFFLTGEMLYGAKVAAAGLLVFIWHPDLWYAVTLASHDIPGIFWLSLFFLVCALLQRRLAERPNSGFFSPAVPVLSISLGLILFFLDFTRSYHIAAILALLATVGLRPFLCLPAGSNTISAPTIDRDFNPAPVPSPGAPGKSSQMKGMPARILWMLILPLSFYYFADWSFWKAWHVKREDSGNPAVCYYTTMEVLGASDWTEISNWYEGQCPKIPEPERRAFALRKLVQGISHDPWEFIRYLQRKNRKLSVTTDYIDWSTVSAPERNDPTAQQVKHVNHLKIDEQRNATALGYAIVLVLVIVRLLLLPRLPFNYLESIVLLFSGILYATMLFVLESQGRYDVFLVFPLSWMAAQTMCHLSRGPVEQTASAPLRGVSRLPLFLTGTMTILMFTALYWISARLVADTYVTLRDQSGFSTMMETALPSNLRGHTLVPATFPRNNYKQMMVNPPIGPPLEADSILAVQRTFDVKSKADRHLRFFLSVAETKSGAFEGSDGWADADFRYYIAIDGKVIGSGRLSDIHGDRYFSFNKKSGLSSSPQITLQLILRNMNRVDNVIADRGPIIALQYIDLQ